MKYVSGDSVALTELEPLFFAYLNCKGTTLATTAAPIALGNTYAKMVIMAKYIDASNFAVAMPQIPSFGPTEVDVFAVGPNGSAVTLFLSGSQQFVDGTRSVSIACGAAKKLASLDYNSGTGVQIIGIMG